MVSISASSRQNLLALIDTTKQTNDISSKMIEGKRVLSVSDNAFSFYQAKSFDARQTNLTAVNDKVGIALKTLTSADKGAKGIKSELSKLQGLLTDLTTNSAANASTFQANGAVGVAGATNIFNQAGSPVTQITTGTELQTQLDTSFSAADSIFETAGTTAATLLTATAANDFDNADVLTFSFNGVQRFFRVIDGAFTASPTGATQFQAGNTAANAVEVRTVGDLVNALNGKASNGTTALAATAQFAASDNVAASWNINDGLRISTSSTAATDGVSLTRTGAAAGDAAAIFGGTAGALAGTTAITTIAQDAITAVETAGQLKKNDIIQVRVGDTAGGGTQQSLFMKVVKTFSQGVQAGDGLSAVAGGGSTGALEVRTIGDIVNALNGRNANGGALAGFNWGAGNTVSASFDSSKSATALGATESRFSLSSSTALQISVNRAGYNPTAITSVSLGALASSIFGGTAGTAAGAGTPVANSVANFAAQLTSAAQEKRTSVARVFQASLDQVDNLTNDATFGGNNLLNSAGGFNVDLTDASSAATLSRFQVRLSGATDAVSLGFAAKVGGVYQDGAQSNFNSNALVNAALVKTQNALARLEGRQVEIDSLTDTLKTRSEFNETVKTSLGSASNDLTAIDQNEATAQAQAISFGNSVATKFLGTIGQRSLQLIQLFQ